MAKAKKVSFNQATAKSTAGHNDRSMYPWGYDERANNEHWDLYGCGSSVLAEARFYEDTFTPTLEAQNDRALKMRKYDRVMDMETWHWKHPPKEAIVQLGDVKNNDTSGEFAYGVADKVMEAISRAGGVVLSWDIHFDERTTDEDGNVIIGTPHLHIRYVFVGENKDGNPVIDMKNVLLANGIDRPDPSKPTSKTNNPAQTFLETTRTMLEDYADELELAHGNPRVNRERTKRAHSSVEQFKRQKRVEELKEQEKQAIATRDAALAEVEQAHARRKEEDRIRELLSGKTFHYNGELRLGVQGLEERSAELEAQIEDIQAMLEDLTNRYEELSEQVRDREDELAEQATAWSYLEDVASDTSPDGSERFMRLMRCADANSIEQQEEGTSEVPLTRGVMMCFQRILAALLNLVKNRQREAVIEAQQNNQREHEQRVQSVTVTYEGTLDDITTDKTDDYDDIDL